MNEQRRFRVYQNENSSNYSTVFDLINGNDEVKQTKGLAYIFYYEPIVLKEFLKLKQVRKCIETALLNTRIAYNKILNCDYFRVDAEMMSVNKKNPIRRDITITFFEKGIKEFVLIIEAKNIKLNSINCIEEERF